MLKTITNKKILLSSYSVFEPVWKFTIIISLIDSFLKLIPLATFASPRRNVVSTGATAEEVMADSAGKDIEFAFGNAALADSTESRVIDRSANHSAAITDSLHCTHTTVDDITASADKPGMPRSTTRLVGNQESPKLPKSRVLIVYGRVSKVD